MSSVQFRCHNSRHLGRSSFDSEFSGQSEKHFFAYYCLNL
jgi:hypothetical protein